MALIGTVGTHRLPAGLSRRGKHGRRLAASFDGTVNQGLSTTATALQTGDTDWWVGGWVNVRSAQSYRIIACLVGDAGASWQLMIDTITGNTALYWYTAGSLVASAVDTTPVNIDTWYYVFSWFDSAASKINVTRDNAGLATSGTFTPSFNGGVFYVANLTGYATPDGKIAGLAIGRPTVPIAGVVSGINTTLYNGGTPLRPGDTGERALPSWGLVSSWDFAETLGYDPVGGNTLTATGDVTMVSYD